MDISRRPLGRTRVSASTKSARSTAGSAVDWVVIKRLRDVKAASLHSEAISAPT